MDSVAQGVEYREIDGFSGYRVGNDGSVWSCVSMGRNSRPTGHWKRRACPRDSHGYPRIIFRRKGKAITFWIHRLVLQAFVGPCPAGMECCHKDGDRTNNHVSNLRWDTNHGNFLDKVAHGRVPRGEQKYNAKLTADEVTIIKQKLRAGERKVVIADSFGVTRGTVNCIANGRCWTHVA